MTTKKVLFFTAGPVATAAEKTAIEKLNAIAKAPYSVYSRNAVGNFNYGAGKESADYVAGTVPSAYSAVPVIDPDNPPAPTLPATETVIANGATVVVKNSAGAVKKNGTASVSSNTLNGVTLAATEAIVSNGATVAGVTGTGTTATITVANGVVTGIALS